MAKESNRSRHLAPVAAEIRARIAWLIQLRWMAVVGTLVAITVANMLLPDVLPIPELVGVTAFIGLYNVLFHVVARHLRSLANDAKQLAQSVRFVHVQLILDYACLTLLLHFAGGVENPFWAFYVLYIIVAGILLTRTATYVYAGLATILYGGMMLLEYLGIIPHVYLLGIVGSERYLRESYLLATMAAFMTTLFFATLMATSIMTRLRERGRELVRANQELETHARVLAVLNRRLEELDKDRKQFVQLVTHELRAPVAAIQSYIRLILGGYVTPERQPEILDRVQQRAVEQLDQINGLLVLAQSQREPITTKDVSLVDMLNEVLDLLRGPAEEKGLAISLDVDPQIPKIRADPDQIEHLWMNLISNAVKYTPATGSVEITLTQRPASIMGSVKDSGIGIAPKDQERIFDEFYRTDEAKQIEQNGTGLGLAIVKQIVEGYGGRVWVSSAPGTGSKFSFALPKRGMSGVASHNELTEQIISEDLKDE